jgi:hypothetical protein
MGDRAQIRFIFEDGKDVFFYTHWGAHELPEDLSNALRRGEDRWDDEEYLARIIFCEMIQSDVLGTTGAGIGTGVHGDLNRPLITVDTRTKTVNLGEGSGDIPFVDYCNMFPQ